MKTFSLHEIARELRVSRETVKRRLRDVEAEPLESGGYTLRQIVTAWTDDYSAEKARLTKAQADQAEFDLTASREKWVDMAEVRKLLSDRVILPLLQFKNTLHTTYALRCNPDHPEIARVALRQIESDFEKLLRDDLAEHRHD